jgi:hypothetical protein
MTEAERIKCQDRWDTYKNEGQDIVNKVLSNFQEEYGNIPQLEILGKAIYHGGIWVISVRYPSVFDNRKIPNSVLPHDIGKALLRL